MKDEYDFSKSSKNPYAKRLKQQVTIKIDSEAIAYFKDLAQETGISYQNLINLYLYDCAKNKRKLELTFK